MTEPLPHTRGVSQHGKVRCRINHRRQLTKLVTRNIISLTLTSTLFRIYEQTINGNKLAVYIRCNLSTLSIALGYWFSQELVWVEHCDHEFELPRWNLND